MTIKTEYEKYIEKAINYIEEQASNPDIKNICVNITCSEFMEHYECEVEDENGWEWDYWATDVNIANRTWHVSGSGYYGTLKLKDAEYYD